MVGRQRLNAVQSSIEIPGKVVRGLDLQNGELVLFEENRECFFITLLRK